MCMEVLFPERKVFVCIVRQAYRQSGTDLTRKVFIFHSNEPGVTQGHILQVFRTRYGFLESGVHPFVLQKDHQMDQQKVTLSVHDPCFIFVPRMRVSAVDKNYLPSRMIWLQRYDNPNIGNNVFIKLEASPGNGLKHKSREFVSNLRSTISNGYFIKILNNVYTLEKPDHLERAERISPDVSQQAFIPVGARRVHPS